MSTPRYAAFAVASTLLLAACSSDTPTSPAAASQSSIVTAPTIALSRTYVLVCYPDIPVGHRPCRSTAYLSIRNTGGGTLHWTSTKSSYGGWLKRSPTYGTAPSTMKIWVDATGL